MIKHLENRFIGSLITTNNSIANVTLEFESLKDPCSIYATIWAKASISDNILEIFDHNTAAEFNGINQFTELKCTDIYLINYRNFTSEEEELSTLICPIAKLRIGCLKKKARFMYSNSKSRKTCFNVYGPTDYWNLNTFQSSSYRGKLELKISGNYLELDPAFSVTVKMDPNCIIEGNIREPQGATMSSENILEIESTEKESDPFVETIKHTKLANDICLLLSFLSRSEVIWIGRCGNLPDGWTSEIIPNSILPKFGGKYVRGPISQKHGKQFLCKALQSLYLNSVFQPDSLRNALRAFISASSQIYLELEFFALFSTLEYLIGRYENTLDQNSLCDRKTYSTLKHCVSDCIETNISVEMQEQIKKKIPELNRPSIKDRIIEMFEEGNVAWEDLYTSEHKGDMTFVKIRHSIIHSRNPIEYDILRLETNRLRFAVERYLLKSLGWNDLSECPSRKTLEYLQHN